MKLTVILCTFLFLVSAVSVCPAQRESLNNGKVVQMTQAGLSDKLIVRKIRTGTVDFDLSTESLVALKKAGVADLVITAMFDAAQNAPPDRDTFIFKPTLKDIQPQRHPPAQKISRIVLDKADALRNAKTIAINKSSLHPSRQALEKELFKRKDWQNLNLNIVRLKEDADLYVEIGYVSLSWLTHRYVYRVYESKSGTVIVAGETTSWGSLAKNLARGISKRLAKQMEAARKTT